MTASATITEDLTFRVHPSGDPQAEWLIRGELRIPEGGSDTVQVLLPGLTYDRRYWNAPGKYDYAAHMLAAGYAVLLLDRLGTGGSSRPPAARSPPTATSRRSTTSSANCARAPRAATPSAGSSPSVTPTARAWRSWRPPSTPTSTR